MSQESYYSGMTVLITGASSGIGESFARLLAARGAHLILTGRRGERLKAIAEDLEARHPTRCLCLPHDLGVPGAARSLLEQVRAAGWKVDILINNAGFGHYDRFWNLDASEDEAMLRLNVEALTTLTHLVLPDLVASGRGGILNVASTAAFMPVPGFSTYAATKAYVLSLTQALALELRGTGVRVSVLCPGPTRTEFQAHSGTQDMGPAWVYESAEAVAERGLKALERGVAVRVSGWFNQLQTLVLSTLPRSLTAWLAGTAMRFAQQRRKDR